MGTFICKHLKKSFGLKNGKEIFEGYNDERKVVNRKAKEKKRLGYEFFAKSFEKNNQVLNKQYIDKIICVDSVVLRKQTNAYANVIF